MFDAMRFWLDRGVDGFRMDVIYWLIKDDQFRDDPPNPNYKPGDEPYNSIIPVYSCNRPGGARGDTRDAPCSTSTKTA